LEGDEATVTSLYAMIENDKRHKDVTIIQKEKITERAYPYWSMGFEKLDAKEIRKMEGLNDFFEHDFTPSGFASHKNI
jgi:Sensors of blue-light using FAD